MSEIQPHIRRFQSLTEVDAYLDMDPLPCLLCGESLTSLHKHLESVHNMSVHEYRDLFRIPQERSLISKSLREKKREMIRKQRMAGRIKRLPATVHDEFLRRIGTGRTIADVARDEDMPSAKVFDLYCLTRPSFARKVEEVLDNISPKVQFRGQRSGRTVREIIVFMREIQCKTWPQIAMFLDISEQTTRMTYFELRDTGKLDDYRYVYVEEEEPLA
jgi:hypothetical protein